MKTIHEAESDPGLDVGLVLVGCGEVERWREGAALVGSLTDADADDRWSRSDASTRLMWTGGEAEAGEGAARLGAHGSTADRH